MKANPDYIICDSGSDDIGPTSLGSDTSISPYDWQTHDLEIMLVEGRSEAYPYCQFLRRYRCK
jgi:hypothetical protein